MAVVLGVILAAGYAFGDAAVPDSAKPSAQEKVDEREAMHQAAVEEQQSERLVK